jgi:hypothetical protein
MKTARPATNCILQIYLILQRALSVERSLTGDKKNAHTSRNQAGSNFF